MTGADQQFPFDLAFYSLAAPAHPWFISSYVPTSACGLAVKPHEMYLWHDPKRPGRALMWISTPELTPNPAVLNMLIVGHDGQGDGHGCGLIYGPTRANQPRPRQAAS